MSPFPKLFIPPNHEFPVNAPEGHVEIFVVAPGTDQVLVSTVPTALGLHMLLTLEIIIIKTIDINFILSYFIKKFINFIFNFTLVL